jgi:hypothetical protein
MIDNTCAFRALQTKAGNGYLLPDMVFHLPKTVAAGVPLPQALLTKTAVTADCYPLKLHTLLPFRN